MTTPHYQQALGRKIAAERRRRGLSQPELARMIDRSVAWVSQVERGARKVDRMSVLETLATALDIPLAELAAEAPVVAAATEETPGAAGLRLVLSGVYSLSALLNGRRAPATLTRLRAMTSQAWELAHAGRYAELADLLRSLIPDLESAVRTLPEGQRAETAELLATAYQACSAALAKVGEPEAAWIAADRAMAAAEWTGNPLLIAAGAFRLVFVFLAARHYDQAEETARTTADALAHLGDGDDLPAVSLWGGLTLQRAVVAARLNDPDAAYSHLEQARQAAARLGEGRNDLQHRVRPGQRSPARDCGRGRAGRCGPCPPLRRRRRHQRTVRRTARPDAHRRCPRARPAPPGQRGRSSTPPGRGHYPGAGPRARPGAPARLRPDGHARSAIGGAA